MKIILISLFILLSLVLAQDLFAQAPNVTYGSGNHIKVTGTIPFTTSPKNTGGSVPATIYGQVTTFAGSPTVGYVDSIGTAAQFYWPQDMAKDAAGNLYVTDAVNNSVRKITPAGVVTTFAGSPKGEVGFLDGKDTSARFSWPNGITTDAAGNFYVSDLYNNAIRKITPAGDVTTFYQNTNIFYSQGPIFFDNAGNMIVAGQYSYTISKISPAGVGSIIAGTLSTPGYVNGPGAAALFDNPTDVRIDASGNLIVADGNNNAIRKITPSGIVSTLAGSQVVNSGGYANGADTTARFNYSAGVEITQGGIIYVTDYNNNDIRKITPDGIVSLVAGSPTQVSGDADGIGPAAQFNQPTYIRVLDNSGVAYISEFGGNRIRKMVITGYTLNGTLPPGLTFDPTTGIVSGTVTTPFAAQTDTITAYNASGYSTAIVTLTFQPVSTVATLVNLVPSAGSLDPAFISTNTSYTDSVSNATKTITLTPTVTDSTATITVNGVPVVSGTASGDIPLEVGNNTITVVVTAQDGVTTNTYIVTVYRGEAPADLDATNIITPNGDGKNDYWIIKDIALYPQNNVIVFDKGGRVIYSKRAYKNDWDGTLNGRPLAEGTYYFVVDLGPGLRKFKGSLSILRN